MPKNPTHIKDCDQTLSDWLLLVAVKVPPETVATWSDEQHQEAQQWAVKTHLRASDNRVRVPEKPAFVEEAERAVDKEIE